ncbi:MAG: hypothetical protein M1524_03015 [Patescibacteria group bacterium]|nr:hypothetical protein [Patescibacteria group bacterium]
MKGFFKNAFTDKIIFASFFGTIVFILLAVAVVFFSYEKMPPFVPLFNQMPWGEGRLAVKSQIFIPIFIAIIFSGINFTLFSTIYQKMPLVGRLIFATGFLVSFLIFLFIVRTVQIII